MNAKLLPRNASAARLATEVAGNPVTSRPEAGVGNCFPGLEADLRNLERRFFPFLEVDIASSGITVVGVDEDGARAARLRKAQRHVYRRLAHDLGRGGAPWTVESIDGTFGSFGALVVRMQDITQTTGTGRSQTTLPIDPWTCVRLLAERSPVTLVLTTRRRGARERMTLVGARCRYLDEDGALSAIFAPGELTQSLCSPWTHDFRDCGCFYWASNHPDIVQPARPPGQDLDDDAWDVRVPWERSDRGVESAPRAAQPVTEEERWMDHIEINARWQQLDVVLEGRELREPYRPGTFTGRALPTQAALEKALRYAAGVELAVIQEYLCAAYSLDPGAGAPNTDLRHDVTTARAELMRIVFSEMRHLRLVNDVLRELASARGAQFVPALRVAAKIPSKKNGGYRARQFRALTIDVLDEFLDVERPSVAVDGLYARILATLQQSFAEPLQSSVRSIMSDGADHYATFGFIREWLTPHAEALYLRPSKMPAKSHPLHRALQAKYTALLKSLRDGYLAGLPAGAAVLNDARRQMLSNDDTDTLDGICQKLGHAGLRVVFEELGGDFAPIMPP